MDLAPGQGPIKPWEPDRWSPRHALVARMRGAGLTNKEIALATGFDEAKVSIIVNDERARPFIQEAADNIAAGIIDLNLRFKHHAEEALDTIVSQMRTAGNELIKQRAAFGILDRAGYTPLQKHAIVPAPQLPPELGTLVAEAHAEITVTRREVRYRLPSSSEIAEPEGRDLTPPEARTGT